MLAGELIPNKRRCRKQQTNSWNEHASCRWCSNSSHIFTMSAIDLNVHECKDCLCLNRGQIEPKLVSSISLALRIDCRQTRPRFRQPCKQKSSHSAPWVHSSCSDTIWCVSADTTTHAHTYKKSLASPATWNGMGAKAASWNRANYTDLCMWRYQSDGVVGIPSVYITAYDLVCLGPNMVVLRHDKAIDIVSSITNSDQRKKTMVHVDVESSLSNFWNTFMEKTNYIIFLAHPATGQDCPFARETTIYFSRQKILKWQNDHIRSRLPSGQQPQTTRTEKRWQVFFILA